MGVSVVWGTWAIDIGMANAAFLRGVSSLHALHERAHSRQILRALTLWLGALMMTFLPPHSSSNKSNGQFAAIGQIST